MEAIGRARGRVARTSFDQEFGSFTSIGYADVGFKAQLAFLDESVQDKRIRWLAEQEATINNATTA